MDIIDKLGINATFFVQLINFVILVFILYKLLYKPLFKTLNERTDRIKKGIELTAKLEKEFEQFEKRKQDVLKKAQDQASEIIINAQDKASKNALKILEDTKKRGDEILDDYRKTVELDKQKLREDMNGQVYESVNTIMSKLFEEDKLLDKKFIEKVILKQKDE